MTNFFPGTLLLLLGTALPAVWVLSLTADVVGEFSKSYRMTTSKLSKGRDSCITNEDLDAMICIDTYNKVAYCCDSVGGYYTRCCYYTKVWALWYFWFGIVMFLLLLGACTGGGVYYKKSHSDNSETSSNSGADEEQRVVFVTTTQQVPVATQPAPIVDAPPAYSQISPQDQAVISQTNEIEKYDVGSQNLN